MAELHEEIAQEVAGRQAEITAALRVLDGLEEDDPAYEAAFARLVRAGSELIEYEAEVPARLEEPRRRASAKAFFWSLGAHAAEGVLLGSAALLGWIGWGWAVLSALQLVLVVVLAVSGRKTQAGKHEDLRMGAGILAVVTVLVPLLVFGVLPGWLWLLPALGWIAVFGFALELSEAAKKASA
ncbi:hypothetical protein AB0469_35305 [Streptomyces sp. NPDC093801]|uniref:hypothetical protein n=1 Tax=Streptomyces sp. NPDC093801 TaxID=3155203 RepID=UPI00344E48F7